MKFKTIAALLCAGAVAGCGGSAQLIGVPPSLQQSNLLEEEDLQERMVAALIRKANTSLPELKANPALWKDVAEAGLLEVDIQCDRYLAALFTFSREQRAGRQKLTAAGASTAALLGLTGSAGTTVATVAAAFGLAANVFDAGAGSVLFTVSPTAIRAVAVRGRQAFLAGIDRKQITSRPLMMIVVQGYLAQCTPAAIEANIDNAATGAPSVSNIDTALKAAALAASIRQNSSIFMVSPVTPPANNPVKVVKPDLPINTTTAESAFIRNKTEAISLQNALGTTPDGDLGPPGVTPLRPNSTRLAISEYNAGVRAAGRSGAVGDVMDGNRNAYVALIGRGVPLVTSGLKSPFERALLGDQPTCSTIRDYMDAVKGPVIQESDRNNQSKCMDIFRGAIKERRKELNMEPADFLDSNLYDQRPPNLVIDRPK